MISCTCTFFRTVIIHVTCKFNFSSSFLMMFKKLFRMITLGNGSLDFHFCCN